MKRIPLTQNKITLIDNKDFELISKYKWFIQSKQYAATWINGELTLLHRLILGLKKGDKRKVDHINHNGLDNRHFNIRICTHIQNLQNRKKQKNNKNGIKGITANHKNWMARIQVNGKSIYLGTFKTKKEAKRIRKQAEQKYFGEFAYGCKN